MPPKTTLLMRHAEKPSDRGDPNLSPEGQLRAKELPRRIARILDSPINFLFAAEQSVRSDRPVLTLTPLSEQTGLGIDSTFADKDYPELAAQLLTHRSYDGKTVVICWHHESLPDFAHALMAPAGTYPKPWPPEEFDLILRFDEKAGSVPTVQQLHSQ